MGTGFAQPLAIVARTDAGMVRIYIEAEGGIELPLDFDPEEAEEIAEELLAAAERARGMAPRNKPASGKPSTGKPSAGKPAPAASRHPAPRGKPSGPAGARTKDRR